MKKRQKTLLFLMIAGLLLFLPVQIVRAAGLSIEYGGKEISYTDTQVRYSLDGEMISSLYPGIIVNGISLAPFSDIFI